MKRAQIVLVTALALVALSAAGLMLLWRANWSGGKATTETHAHIGTGPIIYYRDPDGPFFSIAPKKNDAGKDYVAVRASEDVSFEDKPPAPTPNPTADRRIRYYRNPMGLPDTSPVPKKDAMGMDYVPVYEYESQDASTVTLSPEKMQKTGVRSEPVGRRTVTVPIRASGRVDFDPRRTAVVSLRFEGFIESVEKVAEGTSCAKQRAAAYAYLWAGPFQRRG